MEDLKKYVHPSLLVYFSNKGESMSDAQNMKGKCTHIAEDVMSFMGALGPVRSTMKFEGTDIEIVEPLSATAKEIEGYVGMDAHANALNGWYARALESKSLILERLKAARWQDFMADGEEILSERYETNFEERTPVLQQFTEEDVLSDWPANDIADFLVKEQYCATVGKLIHKNGILYKLYNTPLSKKSDVREMASGSGYNKAYPVKHEPNYTGKELDNIKSLYMETHDKHREMEKKVNWYKAKLKNEVTERNAEAARKYSDELSEFRKKQQEYEEVRASWLNGVRNKNNQLNALCEARRQDLIKVAAGLKIFIPEVLREIKTGVESYKKRNGSPKS
jgi:hypothetical protein